MKRTKDLQPAGDIIGTYRHFKGGLCTVLGVAKHSETLEDMVVYHHADDENLWVRPKAMFFEEVEVDATKKPRFARIEHSS